MKNIKGISLVLYLILLLGCKPSERKIGLFFNPSRAFDLQKIHLLASSGSNVILDTVIENNHIDKSVLLKTFDSDLIVKNTLLLEIGSKSESIKIPNKNQSCLDIFTFYDDHTIINDKVLKIENEKVGKVNYKQIVDSLKKINIGVYDKIEIDIKIRDCKL